MSSPTRQRQRTNAHLEPVRRGGLTVYQYVRQQLAGLTQRQAARDARKAMRRPRGL